MQDMKIQNPIQPIVRPDFNIESVQQVQPSSFGKVLQQSIDQVNRLQLEADGKLNNLTTGRQTDIHQTLLKVEKANVSFDLLMQIRNKVIMAYEKMMQMQV
jgi:flagellar hook-basal body complex protein FliE